MQEKRSSENKEVKTSFKYIKLCDYHFFLEQNPIVESQRDKAIKILYCLCFDLTKIWNDNLQKWDFRRTPLLKKKIKYQIDKDLKKAGILDLTPPSIERTLTKIASSGLISPHGDKYAATVAGLAYLYSNSNYNGTEWISDGEALELIKKMKKERYPFPRPLKALRERKIKKYDLDMIRLYGGSFDPKKRDRLAALVGHVMKKARQERLREAIQKLIEPLLDDEELLIEIKGTDPVTPIKIVVTIS